MRTFLLFKIYLSLKEKYTHYFLSFFSTKYRHAIWSLLQVNLLLLVWTRQIPRLLRLFSLFNVQASGFFCLFLIQFILGSNVHLFGFSLKQFFFSFGIRRGGRLLIADEMGLGKTVQALAIASAFRFFMLFGRV